MRTYSIDEHEIKLNEDVARRFEDIVCPIVEEFLRFQIKIFGEFSKDDVELSKKLENDMRRELAGYDIQKEESV